MAWTITSRFEIESSSDAASYTSASFTPTGNRLLIAMCITGIAGAGGQNRPTISSTHSGMTISEGGHLYFDTSDNGGQITWWIMKSGSSPGSGTLSFDFAGQTQTGCVAVCHEYNETGLTLAADPLSHLVQSKYSTADPSAAQTASITLDGSPVSTNMVVGMGGTTGQLNNTGYGTNFAAGGGGRVRTAATPYMAGLQEHDLASATTTVDFDCDVLGTGTAVWGLVGVEISPVGVNQAITMTLLSLSPAFFAPTIPGGQNIVYLYQAKYWNSPNVTWNDAGTTWNEGGTGIPLTLGTLYAPTVKLSVQPGLLSLAPTFYEPTVVLQSTQTVSPAILSLSPTFYDPALTQSSGQFVQIPQLLVLGTYFAPVIAGAYVTPPVLHIGTYLPTIYKIGSFTPTIKKRGSYKPIIYHTGNTSQKDRDMKDPLTAGDEWFTGEDQTFVWDIRDGSGSPVNVTGWTVQFDLALAAGQTAVYTKAATQASTYRLQVASVAADTVALDPKTYFYTLSRTDSGLNQVLAYGTARLQARIP